MFFLGIDQELVDELKLFVEVFASTIFPRVSAGFELFQTLSFGQEILNAVLVQAQIGKILNEKPLNSFPILSHLLARQLFGQLRQQFINKRKARVVPQDLSIKVKISIHNVEAVQNLRARTVQICS